MWLGYAKQLSGFKLLDGTELLSKNPDGSVSRACKWYTNLEVKYRNDRITLTESIKDKKYEKYYNYNGINIQKLLKFLTIIKEKWEFQYHSFQNIIQNNLRLLAKEL